MNFRFPGAETKEAFWDNLANGRELVTFFSDEELRKSGIQEKALSDQNYVKARGVIEDVEFFDFETLGYLQKEAASIDPQQRVLLECAWHALEDAGYGGRQHECPVGVYVCASRSTYLENLFRRGIIFDESYLPFLAMGNSIDFLANRLAYKLNLRGPTVVAQTACSSSLVCVHLACQGLLFGDCDIAIAGGVSITIPQSVGYYFREEDILSPDGHCRAFDAQARGTVRGHGVAVLVLKRLEDAIKAGDHVYAVILGSAVNNDGGDRIGFSGPSPRGQAEVIERALQAAGISSSDVSYVEAHGSGTAVGDTIELAALTQVFGTCPREQPCVLGSVKTNFGHLDATAGIAGLIKTIFCLKHSRYVPSLHFNSPNPSLNLAGSPFLVSTTTQEWSIRPGGKRVAGVSSFGLGGTNCHLIVGEPPEPLSSSIIPSGTNVLFLSARTATALETMTTNLSRTLEEDEEIQIQDVAFTLQFGREHFPWRRAIIGLSRKQICDDLKARNPETVFTVYNKEKRQVPSFLISGMGEDYPGMGAQLYASEPVFRKYIDICSDYLKQITDINLREVLYDLAGFRSIALAQPTQFVVNYALARLWMSKGVQPKSLLGYSLGEYVAATLAGVFNLEDAIGIVVRRSALIQSLPQGAMIAVGLAASSLQQFIKPPVSIAAENGREMSVASGPADMIKDLCKWLTENRIAWRSVSVQHAFHSVMMDPIRSELVKYIAALPRRDPKIPFVSNVYGSWISGEQAMDPAYWGKHLCSPVLFFTGLKTLCGIGTPTLVEIGPSNTLSSLAVLALASETGAQPFVTPSLCSDKESEVKSFYRTLARLQLMGVELDWNEFYKEAQPRRVALPGYPFERSKCIIELTDQKNGVEPEPLVKTETITLPKKAGALRPRPIIQTPYTPPTTEVEISLIRAWEHFFGFGPIGVHDNFFELGGHSLLAIQLLQYIRRMCSIRLTIKSFFQYPTVSELATSFPTNVEEKFEMSRFMDALTRGDADAQSSLLHSYLAAQVRQIVAREIHHEEEFTVDNMQELVPHLIYSVKEDMNVPLFAHEITKNNSVARLAKHLQSELARKLSPASHHAHSSIVAAMLQRELSVSETALRTHKTSHSGKNKPIIFILSSARSGSTLLRLLLAGHPQLFSPPELHLLQFVSLRERQSALSSHHFGLGLQRALMELFGCDRKTADQKVTEWLAQDLSIRDVYGVLQEKAQDRQLVDKSPESARMMATLLRTEDLFSCPKYVFLSRHPYSVIDSYVKNRIYAVTGNSLASEHPYAAAEYHWALYNQNIQLFLRSKPKSQVHWLKFEDLVRNPSSELNRLCAFLGVTFCDEMLDPYGAGRMIDGPGDPNIAAREAIIPELADSWKSVRLPVPLGPMAHHLTQEFQYELPGTQ
jgi:acyl transferase domain-containing protein